MLPNQYGRQIKVLDGPFNIPDLLSDLFPPLSFFFSPVIDITRKVRWTYRANKLSDSDIAAWLDAL